jgi:hypothetical protein
MSGAGDLDKALSDFRRAAEILDKAIRQEQEALDEQESARVIWVARRESTKQAQTRMEEAQGRLLFVAKGRKL